MLFLIPKILLTKSDPSLSLERCKISPDGQYLVFETYNADHHTVSPYDLNPDTSEKPVSQILDLRTHTLLPLHINGGNIQWIE